VSGRHYFPFHAQSTAWPSWPAAGVKRQCRAHDVAA
jgi:hypothetical protein